MGKDSEISKTRNSGDRMLIVDDEAAIAGAKGY